MNLKLSNPRARSAHLASFEAAKGMKAKCLRLSGEAGDLVAERDPSQAVYHVAMPPVEAGEVLSFDVAEAKDAGAAGGISAEESDGQVEIGLGGSHLMTFRYGADYPKPVINPILTPRGTNMLREPMEAWTQGEHPWQRGLTLMQGAINGIDCWNEKTPEEFGRTEQDKISVDQGPLSLTIATENSWYVDDRKLMTDSRSYRLFDTDRSAAILDIALTLKASEGDVTIGDTKEGGFLCIRVNPTMNAADGGTMSNAYGANDEKGCWSLPSHWMDYYGPVSGETAGFAIFDHPSNFRYPTTWHVRGYGLFAPNCWMFKPDHLLASGDSMTFRWRVTIHTGGTYQADIPTRFLDYVDGMRVEKG